MGKLIKDQYFKTWQSMLDIDIQQEFSAIEKQELESHSFTFYTSVSVMSSSKIEGEQMELDSYVKHKRFGIKFLPEYTRKIDDLYNAYQFAKTNPCCKENIEKVHKILTTHILPKNKQGRVRTGNMYVTTHDGRIEYVAASPFIVNTEMDKLYVDIKDLLSTRLNIQEVF